jgi:hypothetical protein
MVAAGEALQNGNRLRAGASQMSHEPTSRIKGSYLPGRSLVAMGGIGMKWWHLFCQKLLFCLKTLKELPLAGGVN